MKNFFYSLLIVSFLSLFFVYLGDKINNKTSMHVKKLTYSSIKYNYVCINGIVYLEGYKRIAPFIDKETKGFMTCKEFEKKYGKGKTDEK